MESINELSKLLGAENEQILKKNIVDIISERFRDDLEQMNQYIIYPSIIEDFLNEVIEECKEEMKKVVKKKLKDNIMKKLETV